MGRFPVTWQTLDMVAALLGPRIRPAKLCAVNSACCAADSPLYKPFFREGNAASVADDQVVEQADLDQREGVPQPGGDDIVRLAGLRVAGRVVVGAVTLGGGAGHGLLDL